MKTTFIIFFVFLCAPLFARTAEFTVEHEYQANRNYTFNDAQAAAMQEAQADLLRQLGVLVEARQRSATTTIGGNIQEDFFVEEAKTYTLGRVRTEVVEERLQRWSEFIYSATFRMEVDTADLFKYLNNIVRQREQARADSIAQIERTRADSIALVERTRADSVARVQRISELEQAVRVARRSLEQERESERPLRIERDGLEQELQRAETQQNSAQIAFNNARNAADAHSDLGMRRIENERSILQEAIDNHNRKSAESRIAKENWQSASQRVAIAQNGLQIAENNLAQEMGGQARPAQNIQAQERVLPPIQPTTVETVQPQRQTASVFDELETAARARQQVPTQAESAFDQLRARRTGEHNTRASLEDFAATQRARNNLPETENNIAIPQETRRTPTQVAPPTAPILIVSTTRSAGGKQNQRNGHFVFSIRPELVAGNSAMGAGGGIELGGINERGRYFSVELNGGGVYFGGGLNLGKCFNQNGAVKNVLGLSAGFWNALYFVDFARGGQIIATGTGYNIGIAGPFWKLMLGQERNFSIKSRILLGYAAVPMFHSGERNQIIYETELNTLYTLSVGYTLIKRR